MIDEISEIELSTEIVSLLTMIHLFAFIFYRLQIKIEQIQIEHEH